MAEQAWVFLIIPGQCRMQRGRLPALALPLDRQELDEGLAKRVHSPLLYMHIKRGGDCFSLVCPGFVHILL